MSRSILTLVLITGGLVVAWRLMVPQTRTRTPAPSGAASTYPRSVPWWEMLGRGAGEFVESLLGERDRPYEYTHSENTTDFGSMDSVLALGGYTGALTDDDYLELD